MHRRQPLLRARGCRRRVHRRVRGPPRGPLKVGPGLEEGTGFGPLVNEDTRSKVASLADEATSAGSRVVTGGSVPDRRGALPPPTVLDNVPPGALHPGRGDLRPGRPDRQVRLRVRGGRLGQQHRIRPGLLRLHPGPSRALRVAEALEAGMIGINRGVVSDPAAPFGGVKQSGLGREGGHEGLLEFTETKYIAVVTAHRRLMAQDVQNRPAARSRPTPRGAGARRRAVGSGERPWTDESSGLRTEYGSPVPSAAAAWLSPDEVARYFFRRVVSWGPEQ